MKKFLIRLFCILVEPLAKSSTHPRHVNSQKPPKPR